MTEMVELLPRYSNLANLSKLCHPTTRRPDPVARPRVHAINRRLSPDTIQQLLDDYRTGTPSTQLADKYNLAKSTVLQLLRSHGIPLRNRPMPPDHIQQAIQLYGQGLSLSAVGRQLGYDHSVIRTALERSGIQRRDSHGRAR